MLPVVTVMRLLLQVMFHGNRFLSGSVDGLINVFDLSSGFDEDEGFLVSMVFNQENDNSAIRTYNTISLNSVCRIEVMKLSTVI